MGLALFGGRAAPGELPKSDSGDALPALHMSNLADRVCLSALSVHVPSTWGVFRSFSEPCFRIMWIMYAPAGLSSDMVRHERVST